MIKKKREVMMDLQSSDYKVEILKQVLVLWCVLNILEDKL